MFTYILPSELNLSYYKGSTKDLARRILEHSSSRTISTSRYAPWVLEFAPKSTKQEAVALELKLKNLLVERTINFIKNRYAPPVGVFDVQVIQR
ncbi:MAG: GIY-YIG nuclease family protein [Cytophagales bacterium]